MSNLLNQTKTVDFTGRSVAHKPQISAKSTKSFHTIWGAGICRSLLIASSGIGLVACGGGDVEQFDQKTAPVISAHSEVLEHSNSINVAPQPSPPDSMVMLTEHEDGSKEIVRQNLLTGAEEITHVSAAEAKVLSPFVNKSIDNSYIAAVLYTGNDFTGAHTFVYVPDSKLTNTIRLRKKFNSGFFKPNCKFNIRYVGATDDVVIPAAPNSRVFDFPTSFTTRFSVDCKAGANVDAVAVAYTGANYTGSALPIWRDGWNINGNSLDKWQYAKSIFVNEYNHINANSYAVPKIYTRRTQAGAIVVGGTIFVSGAFSIYKSYSALPEPEPFLHEKTITGFGVADIVSTENGNKCYAVGDQLHRRLQTRCKWMISLVQGTKAFGATFASLSRLQYDNLTNYLNSLLDDITFEKLVRVSAIRPGTIVRGPDSSRIDFQGFVTDLGLPENARKFAYQVNKDTIGHVIVDNTFYDYVSSPNASEGVKTAFMANFKEALRLSVTYKVKYFMGQYFIGADTVPAEVIPVTGDEF
jgi:hypothetical protein